MFCLGKGTELYPKPLENENAAEMGKKHQVGAELWGRIRLEQPCHPPKEQCEACGHPGVEVSSGFGSDGTGKGSLGVFETQI